MDATEARRLSAAIAFWSNCTAKTPAQRRLVARTIADLQARLAAL